MKIRDATKLDLGSMAELLLFVHQMHVNAHPETYREISQEIAVEFLAAKLTDDTALLRVAEIESEVHAYCSAMIRSSPGNAILRPREVIHVNEIVVRPECRLKGVGTALFIDLKEFARQKNIRKIELDVSDFNSGAKAFYATLGFKMLRERLAADVSG